MKEETAKMSMTVGELEPRAEWAPPKGRVDADNAPAGTSTRVDMTALKAKSVRGGMVTMLSQGISILIQLVSTVALARLLRPEDYGMIAMVAAVTSFAGLFRDLGLSSAAIQKRNLTNAQQSNLFWLNVAMGALLTGITVAVSPVVAWFYGKPELQWVTVALSANFVIGSVATQHGAMLTIKMQFGRNAAAGIVGSFVTFVVAVFLATWGYAYWALVWSSLCGAVCTTCLRIYFSPFRPGIPCRGTGIREMIKFGAHITAFDLVNYFHRNLDNILIGRVWGASTLGLYSRAYSLLMLPIQTIRSPLNSVAFPALSSLQDSPDGFRSYYRRLNGLVAFVSMPFTAFLFAASEPIVELALGKQWLGIVPIFNILAISALIQPVAGLRGVIMLSLGRGKAYLMWGVLNAVVVTIGFLIGVIWGAVGVAISYTIANYVLIYPSLLIAFKDTPLEQGDFFGPIVRPLFASVSSALISGILIKQLAPTSAVSVLFLGAVGFVLTYVGIFVAIPGGWTAICRNGDLWRQFTTRAKVTA